MKTFEVLANGDSAQCAHFRPPGHALLATWCSAMVQEERHTPAEAPSGPAEGLNLSELQAAPKMDRIKRNMISKLLSLHMLLQNP